MAFLAQNQKSAEVLNLSAKQMDAIQKLHDDLQALAKSDPAAAKIVAEYFPPAPVQGQGSTTGK